MKAILLILLLASSASAGVVTYERVTETIMRESGGNPRAVGLAGEVGLGQIKPVAVRDLREYFGWTVTEKDRWCPRLNRVMTEGFLVLTEKRLAKRLKRPPTWREVEAAYINGVDGYLKSFRQGLADVTGRVVPRMGPARGT